jgi:hypothetical protein
VIEELEGFSIELSVQAARHGYWIEVPLPAGGGAAVGPDGLRIDFRLGARHRGRQDYRLSYTSSVPTRLRLRARLPGAIDPFHLIPACIHGDNNAAHVRPGEFPVLATDRPHDRSRAPLWEFRADRASHPVSVLCCPSGAVGLAVDPYSDCAEAADGFIRNGVFAALPDSFGVSLGYGNDPLTFVEKTYFRAATADLARQATCGGSILAARGDGRLAAHSIVREIYRHTREIPRFRKNYRDALRGLTTAFAMVSWSPKLRQYTNCRCRVPDDTTLQPWRAIVEIGWTGGSMLALPFMFAATLAPDLSLPKTGERLFDEICTGYNDQSGFINDTAINRFTENIPGGWNASTINGWWSGFLPQTQGNHCAYTNGHAAYYLLRAARFAKETGRDPNPAWASTALRVLDTACQLQRDDGAFGYVFSQKGRAVIDWDGFAGCWFAAALALAWEWTGQARYGDAAASALSYYHNFVRDLAAWGSPMDTFKSIDSEGNLAFMRAARHMHERTGDDRYLAMLADSAAYEYLWRYGFRSRPECAPLKGSNWNSCGGTVTSVSNPHIHPMGVVATRDLEYLAERTGGHYHQDRADDGMAWLMNTLELYPEVMGYGRYGVVSERTCPSDGLLSETYADTGAPASTWWSYNAWAGGAALEALAEQLLAGRREPTYA